MTGHALPAHTPGRDTASLNDRLSGILRPAEWTRHAACPRHLRLFDLANNLGDLDRQPDEPSVSEAQHQAKLICRHVCPVTLDCFKAGLANPDSAGIWGGTNALQRGHIRAERAKRKEVGMSDQLDDVVRGLEAERHRPSVWWHHVNHTPNQDIAGQLDRLRDLAASTEPTISTPQPAGLPTSIKEQDKAAIHRHAHRDPSGRYARKDDPSTGAVGDGLDAVDLPKHTNGSSREE